jgi:hypothetical protein
LLHLWIEFYCVEQSMKNALAVATLVALFTMSAPALVGGADAASDVERAKQQTLIIPDLQKAADAAARFKNESVKQSPHHIKSP